MLTSEQVNYRESCRIRDLTDHYYHAVRKAQKAGGVWRDHIDVDWKDLKEQGFNRVKLDGFVHHFTSNGVLS